MVNIVNLNISFNDARKLHVVDEDDLQGMFENIGYYVSMCKWDNEMDWFDISLELDDDQFAAYFDDEDIIYRELGIIQ